MARRSKHFNPNSYDPFDYDDDGKLAYGMSNKIFEQPTIRTLQDLLLEWLPDSYQEFINVHKLQGIIEQQQLESLFTDRNTRAGKNLMGILSIIAPPEIIRWEKLKHIWERQGTRGNEIDITDEQKRTYLNRLASFEQLSFGQLLRLNRRANLLTTPELGNQADVLFPVIIGYEHNKFIPGLNIIHEMCDALHVDNQMRGTLLDAAGKGAYAKLESKNKRTQKRGLESFIGGGSIFGALLYHLRSEKKMSQIQLAHQCGISPPTVVQYELGGSYPSADIVHKICDELEVDKKMRLILLDVAGKGAYADLDDENKEIRQRGLKAFIGSKTLLGATLLNLRIEKGLGKKKLGQLCGVSNTPIWSYEQGESVPSDEMLDKLCDALGVDDHVVNSDVSLRDHMHAMAKRARAKIRSR